MENLTAKSCCYSSGLDYLKHSWAKICICSLRGFVSIPGRRAELSPVAAGPRSIVNHRGWSIPGGLVYQHHRDKVPKNVLLSTLPPNSRYILTPSGLCIYTARIWKRNHLWLRVIVQISGLWYLQGGRIGMTATGSVANHAIALFRETPYLIIRLGGACLDETHRMPYADAPNLVKYE